MLSISNEIFDKLKIFKGFIFPFFLLDDRANIHWGNNSLWKLLDYEQIPNMVIPLSPNPADKYQENWELFLEKLNEHQPFNICLSILKLNGNMCWVELDIQPFSPFSHSTEFLYVVSARDITQQKDIEAQLVREQHMLEKTGQMASIGGWEYDLISKEIIWTKEVYRLYNVPFDVKLSLELVMSRFPEEDQLKLYQAVERAINFQESYDLELQFNSHNNKCQYVRGIGTPSVENGKTVKLTGIIQDITERKLAEKEIVEREQLLYKLTQNVPGAIYQLNLDPNGFLSFPFLSEGFRKLYPGFDVEEVKQDASPTVEIIHPEDAKVLIEKMGHSAADLSEFNLEYRVIIEGHERWLHATSMPERTDDGCTVWYGIFRDVTEEKITETELRLMQSVVEHTSDSILITNVIPRRDVDNSEGTSEEIIYVNSSFVELTGYSKEEMLGETPILLVGPQSSSQELKKIRHAIEHGHPTEVEMINYKKDGTQFWANIVISPVIDKHGNITHWVSILRDVTHRKKEEFELIQAKEQAEASSLAKSEFLSTMSHEIRTPLNAIIGMTGLLADTILDTEQQNFLQTIRQGGENLLSVINDILDYSKIESGNLELEMIDFSVLEPIEDTLELLATKASEKRLELLYEVDEQIPHYIKGDITRLKQILVNLIGNAIKFTQIGEIVVSVVQTDRRKDSIELLFSVKDTGIGIPKEKQNKLFKSFSQVDASTTREHGGTGLGLAISKKLVEMHGGNIWVESVEGKGSTFCFTLMVGIGSNQHTSNSQKLSFNGKRVAVIDDNYTNRIILQKQLNKMNMEVALYSSPNQMLGDLNKVVQMDLIIMDMHMPEMNGLTLAKLIRKKPLNKHLPMILLSSGVTIQTAEQKRMFDIILHKPIRKKELQYHINFLLSTPDNGRALLKPSTQLMNREKLNLSNYHILLVEDNLVNQQVAKKMLQKFNAEYDIASNGEIAIDKVKSKKFDLVLMDLQMPVMDGLESTKTIRATSNIKQPIILAMTANASLEVKEICLEAGMNDYIPKPVKIDILQAYLRKWLLDLC